VIFGNKFESMDIQILETKDNVSVFQRKLILTNL
jgi:hypothetical protein